MPPSLCLVQLKIAREAPRLLGFAIYLDDPRAVRPDSHCNFGDRSVPGLPSDCSNAAQVPQASRAGATALFGTHAPATPIPLM